MKGISAARKNYRGNTRAAAADAIGRIIQSRARIDQVIAAVCTEFSMQDRQFIAELVYGVVRWHLRLSFYLTGLLDRPLKAKHADISTLLLVGMYQIEFMRVARYAAVSQTVAGADVLGKPWARSLINAILRKFLVADGHIRTRQIDAAIRYSHPQWMVEMLEEQWPDDWQDILRNNNMRPVMVLRVNLNRCSVPQYLQLLKDQQIAASAAAAAPAAVVLHARMAPAALPGFTQGLVSVQNMASQMAAPALALQSGYRVLDACSAPGGKLTHMLELEPAVADMTALDISEIRCSEILDNLARMGQSARVMTADAAQPKNWWSGDRFDRILLDAPCSAVGVIRKHPDIKIHRRATDVMKSSAAQKRLLGALLPLLGPGGKLLYTTCSILRQENDDVIGAIVRHMPAVQVQPLDGSFGRATRFGRQRLPDSDHSDGFYYAMLTKES